MIKKLMVAGALAGSMLMGAPAALANSPQMCFADYNRAVGNCGNSDSCERAASMALTDCLQRLAVIHQ